MAELVRELLSQRIKYIKQKRRRLRVMLLNVAFLIYFSFEASSMNQWSELII